jgi:hypothetical protein
VEKAPPEDEPKMGGAELPVHAVGPATADLDQESAGLKVGQIISLENMSLAFRSGCLDSWDMDRLGGL